MDLSSPSSAASTQDAGKGVACRGLFYGASGWTTQTQLQLTSVGSALQSSDKDVLIYFLPGVSSDDIKSDYDFRSAISDEFSLPLWFWETRGYESNGFYGYAHKPSSTGKTLSTYSRFLIKEIMPTSDEVLEDKYQWQYIAFTTLWHRAEDPAAKPKQIVLCFDLSPEMASWVSERFTESPVDWLHCPVGVYSVLAGAVVSRFDTALWGFRAPVRRIEKHREPVLGNTDDMAERYLHMRARYFRMHDLARHIIHETETLEVAWRTLNAVLRSQNDFCTGTTREALACAQSHRSLEVSEQQIQNLGSRARAFEKRLENEIKLGFNLSAAEDNKTSKEILGESRSDSKELTKLVSTLTLIFLPASFVSGFFGMNFFDYQDAIVEVSPSLWLYFVITIPVILLAFAFWHYFSRRSSVRGGGVGLGDVESAELEKVRFRRSTLRVR